MPMTSPSDKVRLLLEKVDQTHRAVLLIQRIRIPGVPVLISRRLQEAYSRKISSGDGREEILQIVLMIGRTRVPDFRNGTRTRVLQIGSRSVVIEERVMWNIIARRSRQTR